MKATKLLVITTLFAWAGLAQAGTVCSDGGYADLSDNVHLLPSDTHAACELGNSDQDSEDNVNGLEGGTAMFGFSDWDQVAKHETDGGWEGDALGTLDPFNEIEGGTWTLPADYWDTCGCTDLMMVFKSGSANSNVDPSQYVGYLITFGTTIVHWANPHSPSANSHISFYARYGSVDVPEPTTLALLGLGLMGAGMARRKKAQA